MPINSLHHRRSTRLPGYDYSRTGAYFVTISAHRHLPLFGQIVDDGVQLSRVGRVIREEWVRSPEVRQEVSVDAFIVMPDHVHGIVFIDASASREKPTSSDGHARATGRSPLPYAAEWARGPAARSLGAFVAGFKSALTARISREHETPGLRVWQRNYYEHVIRNERALGRIREYVVFNHMKCRPDRNWTK